MDKKPDQNSIITQRLQEMQKEWSVLSALNRSFSKVLDKKSFGQALQQSFKEEFGFNEYLVLQMKFFILRFKFSLPRISL